MRRTRSWALSIATLATTAALAGGGEELCLTGEFDLGRRLQGSAPARPETVPTAWCVSQQQGTDAVRFHGRGRSNADVGEDSFTVAYLGADRVRIVNAAAPPDLEFRGTASAAEAASIRRIDPRHLLAEFHAHPEWRRAGAPAGWQRVQYPGAAQTVDLLIEDGRLLEAATTADLPLRGRVPLRWRWSGWQPAAALPERLVIELEGERLFDAQVESRRLTPAEADALWQPSGGAPPQEIPGSAWPARVAMQFETLEEGIHRVTGVRTGFHHLVVDTAEGLVVVDAPAGWVELHQLPPADLVPGLGISGLSERFIDLLARELPGRPLRAVILTHAHDDHAGGARAFAAAGARVLADARLAVPLEAALNRDDMPADRLGRGRVRVEPVHAPFVLPDPRRPIRLMPLEGNPHALGLLGAWLPRQKLFYQADIHTPMPGTPAPRAFRARPECWFARWALRELPADARVMSVHGAGTTTRGDLETWRDSEICRSAPP